MFYFLRSAISCDLFLPDAPLILRLAIICNKSFTLRSSYGRLSIFFPPILLVLLLRGENNFIAN